MITNTKAPLEIFVDGSCLGNPGPMGIGIAAYENGDLVWQTGEHHGQGTNQQAELIAVIRALETCAETHQPIILTDSQYCVGMLEKNWKAKENKELVARARSLKMKTGATIQKVDGHAGIPGNVLADRLAMAAARMGIAA